MSNYYHRWLYLSTLSAVIRMISVFDFGSLSCSGGTLKRFKVTKANHFWVYIYIRSIPARFLNKTNTTNARCVVFLYSLISRVYCLGDISKVFYEIFIAFPVYVIYLMLRKRSMYIQKRESVRIIALPIYPHCDMPTLASRTCYCPNRAITPGPGNKSCKNTCLRIIMKKRFQRNLWI